MKFNFWKRTDELQKLYTELEAKLEKRYAELESTFELFDQRIKEMEESQANLPSPDQKSNERQVAQGFKPFSQRKREYEYAHRKDNLNPTAKAIIRNQEAIEAAKK